MLQTSTVLSQAISGLTKDTLRQLLNVTENEPMFTKRIQLNQSQGGNDISEVMCALSRHGASAPRAWP